jgi:ABC-type phosphate/phosphonate transport system substrate-binding protein
MPLVFNMRMYAVNEDVLGLWQQFGAWVAQSSGIDLVYLSHDAPQPIDALWDRTDAGLVQMCGWPLYRRDTAPNILAAPVYDAPHTNDQAVYWTDMVVSADSPWSSLEDSFGGILAWTLESSHSGFNAPRHLLLLHFMQRGRALYRDTVGPVITPRGAIDAVLEGRADIAPVDGYYHLLLQRHEPQTARKLKTLARTPSVPAPPFVAAHGLETTTVEALRKALLRAGDDLQARATLKKLSIAQFVPRARDHYGILEKWHSSALSHGYPAPA